MRAIAILFRRELLAYFCSPVTWALFALAWAFYGILFYNVVLPSSGGDLYFMTWDGAYRAVILEVLFVPLLTMRLLSEEKRAGTFEMLVTAPVKDHEIVLAKFGAALVVNTAMWCIYPLYAVIMMLGGGEPDFGPILSATLAIVLSGALFLAIGLFASAITPHQVMSGFLGLLLILGVLYLPALGAALPDSFGTLRAALVAADLRKQTEEAARGLLDLVHLGFQVSFTGLFLLFTVRVLEIRKWA